MHICITKGRWVNDVVKAYKNFDQPFYIHVILYLSNELDSTGIWENLLGIAFYKNPVLVRYLYNKMFEIMEGNLFVV